MIMIIAMIIQPGDRQERASQDRGHRDQAAEGEHRRVQALLWDHGRCRPGDDDRDDDGDDDGGLWGPIQTKEVPFLLLKTVIIRQVFLKSKIMDNIHKYYYLIAFTAFMRYNHCHQLLIVIVMTFCNHDDVLFCEQGGGWVGEERSNGGGKGKCSNWGQGQNHTVIIILWSKSICHHHFVVKIILSSLLQGQKNFMINPFSELTSVV